HGFYGGVADEEHGVHHWARRGIVTRAVVCDVEAYRARLGRRIDQAVADPIAVDDVAGALTEQEVEVAPGDVLLLRTGWLSWYRSLDDARRAGLAEDGLAAPGLAAAEETVRLLWDLHVAAVAS